jgi:hypothetical protein
MTKKVRIATALSAPIIGSLAFLGFVVAPSTPAAAASPISISPNSITVVVPPVLYLNVTY